MKRILAVGAMVMLALTFSSIVSAEQTGNAEGLWNGTWISEDYTFFYTQNGSIITGIYLPFDTDTNEAGSVEGAVSEDFMTHSGIWIETGGINLSLSEDGMFLSGTGTTGEGVLDEPGLYEITATRVGESLDPENIWSGNWITPRKTYTLTQNGTHVTGTNQPLPGIEDDPGVFEGELSDDTLTFSGTWTESGRYFYTLSEDTLSFSGTYTDAREPSAQTLPLNATRVR
ncbi:MAG: hypothetical protein JXA44_04565 [Methanospirillaceae archaeon]|nr:hypothetical protein [Methanospirillaceae archaeon]